MSKFYNMRYMASELKGNKLNASMLPQATGAFMKAIGFYKFVNPSHKCCRCHDGIMCEQCAEWARYIEQFDDYSELFILYIMKSKYNKIWDINKKEWIPFDRRNLLPMEEE